MKVRQRTVQHTARKRREQNQHQSKLENERKTLSEALSSSIWKSDKLKVELLERIKDIKDVLDMVETVKKETKARNALAQKNLDQEKPKKNSAI